MESVEHLNRLLVSHDHCSLFSFDGCNLVVIGSFDITYYHSFEAKFINVGYIQCPAGFFAQAFRLGTPDEREKIKVLSDLEPEEHVFCFESDDRQLFITATNLVVNEKLVVYQKK
jgi:hypothetical protein